MTDNSNKTAIDIALPLPMQVVGTLMKLIGTAYPDAEIANGHRSLKFLIPNDKDALEIPEGFQPEEPPLKDEEIQITELGPNGIGFTPPQELAALCLNVMKESFAQFPEAENYLETKCMDKESYETYVMNFRRYKGKTPHELRGIAEAERDAAKKEVEELQKQLAQTQENLKKVLKSRASSVPVKHSEKVSTKKELKALPQETIIKNAHVVAFKRGGEVWYISNVMPKTTAELAASGIEWTVVERGPEQ